ncbi:hypothetical protein G4B88_021721 [Cannabis sativa]|uniref:RNase H type-1 domain-containing protein n=1 Tax=Cannabis sativa TaxID=3483 RepID=A0A7J6DKA0_CANSA|nr:hypothetical protein G4B88_021721 [Cannabis sativa]
MPLLVTTPLSPGEVSFGVAICFKKGWFGKLIWNTRNSILFKKNHTTNNVEEFAVNYLQEYKDAQHSQQHDSQPSEDSNIPQSSHQHRPPSLSPETPALFVDAAIDHHKSLTGAGFVFKRGHQTVLASKFSRLPGVVSPIFSEGQALLQSLNWCIDSQYTPQVVFSDCLNLVSKVNGDWQDNSALSGLVSRIRLLFSNFPGASLQFIPRQFNMEAHNCAREALREEPFEIVGPLLVAMTKYKSAANGKSRMVQNRRSKRLMYKSSPNYQCDTSLDVKKPPCKRATYSKKTSAENANVGNEVMEMKPKVNCDPNNAEERLSPIWWGSLSIHNDNFGNVDVCAAFKSTKISSDIFRVVRQFPSLLPAQVIPRLDVWPTCFDTSPLSDEIVDLYILQGDKSDDIKDLDSSLDYLHAQDLGMTIAVDGTKFLLFSSRHLSQDIRGSKLNVVAYFKEPDGQSSFEGSPQVGRAAIDEGIALVFSTPDEDLIANAVDVFLSSDSNIDGGKIRKTCSSSSIIPRESTNSAAVQVHEKEKSFVTSVMQQALNIVEGDEVTSAAADNGEYANVDVEWLKKLHEELHQVMNTMKKYEKLRLSQRSKAKELKLEKTELGKLQGRVQSLERKISTLERDCERVDSDVHRAKRFIKQFQSNSSIMHGFL